MSILAGAVERFSEVNKTAAARLDKPRAAVSPRVVEYTRLDLKDSQEIHDQRGLPRPRLALSPRAAPTASGSNAAGTLPDQTPSSSTSASSQQIDICSISEQLAGSRHGIAFSNIAIAEAVSSPRAQQHAASTQLYVMQSQPHIRPADLHEPQVKIPQPPAHPGWNLGPVVQSSNRLKRKLTNLDPPLPTTAAVARQDTACIKRSKSGTDSVICQQTEPVCSQAAVPCPPAAASEYTEADLQSAHTTASSLQAVQVMHRHALPYSTAPHHLQQHVGRSMPQTQAECALGQSGTSICEHALYYTDASCSGFAIQKSTDKHARQQDLQAERAEALLLKAKLLASEASAMRPPSIHQLRHNAPACQKHNKLLAVASGHDLDHVKPERQDVVVQQPNAEAAVLQPQCRTLQLLQDGDFPLQGGQVVHQQAEPQWTRVPVRWPSAEADTARNGCQSVQSLRDGALPLQNGRIMHQAAPSCLSSVLQLRQDVLADACQEAAAYQGMSD